MLIQQLAHDPQYFFAMLIAVVISICLHELAHGIVAIWLGDDTPIETGHMTLNPLVHMGPASLICLLLAGVAWGAMPVDRSRLRGRFAGSLVSAAGPMSNILMALAALVALGVWKRIELRQELELSHVAENAQYLLLVFGSANVMLALFNLIPLPPLDGAGILAGLSRSFDHMIQALGPGVAMQLMILVFLGAGAVITPATMWITRSILRLIIRF